MGHPDRQQDELEPRKLRMGVGIGVRKPIWSLGPEIPAELFPKTRSDTLRKPEPDFANSFDRVVPQQPEDTVYAAFRASRAWIKRGWIA